MTAEIISSFPLDEKKTEKGQFYLLSFSLLLQNAIIGLLNPYIAIYYRKQGLAFSILFLIFFANTAGNLAQPIWGGLSDKYDKRKVFLLTAAFMWTLTTIIISLIPEFLIFVIFFGIASFFGSSAQPVGRSLITLITSEAEETEFQSKFGVLLSTAFMVCSWGGGLIVVFSGFTTLFFIAVIMALTSFICIIFTVHEHRVRELNQKETIIANNFLEGIKDQEKSSPIKRKISPGYIKIDSASLSINSSSMKHNVLNLFHNRLFVAILICSFFGSITFSLFFNFFSVFYVESGGDLIMLSFSFIISFLLFLGTNYLGEAIIKRYQSNDHDNFDSKLEKNYTNSEKKTLNFFKMGISEKLKKVFILWSISGFSIFCILIAIMPQALMVILIIYSLPTIPFFFVSMLALTAKVVKTEEKALAIGIQGVFVFLGRSITIYFGALLLDIGGFQLAAIINVILMIFLLLITLITFKQLNRGFIEPDLFKKTKKIGSV